MQIPVFEDLLNKILMVKIFSFEVDLIRVMTVYCEKYKLLILFVFVLQGDVNLTRIHHHVTGILSHGQGKAFIFTWTDKFPGDTNITMNCLLKVFEDLSMVIYLNYKIDHITYGSQKQSVGKQRDSTDKKYAPITLLLFISK